MDEAAGPDPDALAKLYRERFDGADRARIDVVWDVLYADVFGPMVPPGATVLDLGAGTCVFINRVPSGRRIAVDLNPDVRAQAAPGVEVLLTSSDDLGAVGDGDVDLVFTSNFFEHLPSRAALLRTLEECRRVLRPGGRLVVLMPNLRAVGARYFDYLDHTLPLTDRSLVEALGHSGFEVTDVRPRFLPYGANPAGRPTAAPARRSPAAGATGLIGPAVYGRLLAGYLRVPPAQWLLGGQMLVVAERP